MIKVYFYNTILSKTFKLDYEGKFSAGDGERNFIVGTYNWFPFKIAFFFKLLGGGYKDRFFNDIDVK